MMFSLQKWIEGLVDCSRTIRGQLFGLQPPSPFSLSQTNCMALSNFPFRKMFENVQWCSSIVWLPRVFPRYPMDELYVSFTRSSNAPKFHKSSRKKMRFQICAELVTSYARWRITDWKTITLSEFIKFYRQDSHKSLPNFPGRCVIALGRHTNKFSHRYFHLTSSAILPYKWSPGFWCTQYW